MQLSSFSNAFIIVGNPFYGQTDHHLGPAWQPFFPISRGLLAFTDIKTLWILLLPEPSVSVPF
jgi:hypothetical protein